MNEILKDFCSLLFIVILVLPVEAVPNELSEYDNFTEDSGLNKTSNASRYYFDSDFGLICVAAGKTVDSGEIISADELVEEITFLTDRPESESSPVWTADGQYIMYTVERNDSENLESYRMKADGSSIERTGIGEGNLAGFSDINLNGTELIFTKSINSQPGLYLANLENGTVFPVADDPQISEYWGAWCRLGKKITYTQKAAEIPSQLWIVDRDGSNKFRLGTSENVGTGKDWCPLGLRVIYSAKDSEDNSDLWVIDFYGTNQVRLTNTSYNEWNPSFSPNGKWIAYVSDEGGIPDIWLRDIEGNYRSRLTNNTGSPDSVPKWSPDGSKIVFAGYNPENNSEINSTNTDMIKGSNIDGSDIDANGSDIGEINGSNATTFEGSDTATVSGSDIVIIKLVSSSYISPDPEITSLKATPPEGVSPEGNVTISVTVLNEGGNASEGYISVSFPENETIEDAEGTGSNVDVYLKGNSIQGNTGEITAQYPLVELAEYDWGAGKEETLNVTVTPKNRTEEIVFFVRSWLKDDSNDTYIRDPSLSADRDQQGYAVYRYSTGILQSIQ
ncbi:Periplasmic component of the Tol biopolymer transport system-like protein precursor [Methanosarcina siciliae C2J]|uniref:Periplasmic component of the Tol biopolymer transport system-like protein n=1 Tax=Methanosarcina siciliae C2J TaxID=1434118 RepID=A0A0E3LDK0_9EURY|nr:TolB family protein [Methanosarcina siciliae]AKB37406.1 Periplasmic component of the Tol biopolymer transport system-like protein precursor [Methanosarcina siciliae C2J]